MNQFLTVMGILLLITLVAWPMIVIWFTQPFFRPLFEYLADKAESICSRLGF